MGLTVASGRYRCGVGVDGARLSLVRRSPETTVSHVEAAARHSSTSSGSAPKSAAKAQRSFSAERREAPIKLRAPPPPPLGQARNWQQKAQSAEKLLSSSALLSPHLRMGAEARSLPFQECSSTAAAAAVQHQFRVRKSRNPAARREA